MDVYVLFDRQYTTTLAEFREAGDRKGVNDKLRLNS